MTGVIAHFPVRAVSRRSSPAGVGATVTPLGVSYRVWAPGKARIQVAIGGKSAAGRMFDLAHEGNGYFSGRDAAGRAGDSYKYILEGSVSAPDIASRYQPLGVFGPSIVIDPSAYVWTHPEWRRPEFKGRVIYELHIGTFSGQGTFRAAIERLNYLARIGVNTIEIMPVADFPGTRNWGYDGVMLFAPARCYGHPDDFRALVDAAHARGLAVILDVVYNHLGPSGNHFALFTPEYFHKTKENPWGQSYNLSGKNSKPVRSLFVQNALYWIDEFRLDGLRLDATHAIGDESPKHICAEIAEAVHNRGGFVIAEDERNDDSVISNTSPRDWGCDAVWADDFHHSLRVAMTAQRHSYLSSFDGSPEECADILVNGWKYRGQIFPHTGRRRGTRSIQIPPERFVFCISNHDQVGNRPKGDRFFEATPIDVARAASMLLCLSPYTPLLFMGQEWGASTPFLFFTDQPEDLGEKIAEGRKKEFAALYNGTESVPESLPHPQAESTFTSSKLQWSELAAVRHQVVLALYQTCLRLRAVEQVFQNPARTKWKAQAVGPWIALRWTPGKGEGDWLLLTCLSKKGIIDWESPFLAPRRGKAWNSVIFSNDPRFGGRVRAPKDPSSVASPFRNAVSWLLKEGPPCTSTCR